MQTTDSDVEAFFDLKEYFESQLVQLKDIQHIEKTVEINGSRETKTFSKVDFSKELIPFLSTDINRLAWRDKYQVDSVHTGDGALSQLQYTALDEDMKTQKLLIDFKNKIVDSIYIENRVDGFAIKNIKEMTYTPDGRFSIRSQQKPMVGAAQLIHIAVRFKKG